ncbi:MAG TPA: MauE/DoxX family redox-associated membrane protein [Actinophytocola sp.]|jgi:hypothetical protein|uniref:MauE/DoxX family redox-associated membrane protein n=1 Tax=Actinophytocola sp. TaxID=1872138 RepID=UPI002F91D90A
MLAAALAATVAVTFAVSAAAKLSDLAAFRRSMPATLGIPPLRARALAPAVVAAELAVALAAVAGLWSPSVALAGFVASAVLLGVFTVAIRSMIARGVTEPCHCFGARGAPPGAVDLIRNGVLIAVSLGGLIAVALGSQAVGGGFVRLAAGMVVGTATALLVVHLDELVWLFGPTLPGVE